MQNNSAISEERLLRLQEVLHRVGVSRSSWYAGIQRGIFPPPVKLGGKTAVWPSSTINQFIEGIIQTSN